MPPIGNADLTLTSSVDLTGATRDLANFAKNIPSVKLRVDAQPLGVMSKSAQEFNKSLQAAQSRTLAFAASAGSLFAVSRAFQAITKATIETEKQLKDINSVLQLSSRELAVFSNNLFQVANQTGQSFKIAAQAATEFSRQGLGVEETLKRTKDALTLVRLGSLEVNTAVEDLTATTNGFQNTLLNTTKIVDKLVAVDQSFAISVGGLAEALSRTSAVAKDTGVQFDELLGVITAVKQLTGRDAPVIGNALKTIFQRVTRNDTLEDLKQLGVVTEDLNGKTLSSLAILTNLSKVYDNLSDAQKNNVTQIAAGVFQANQFKAILNDLSKQNSITTRATNEAANANGNAARRQEELNDSLSANINTTLNNLQNFASKVGNLTIGPALKNINSLVNSAISSTSIDKVGQDGGFNLGEGVLKGFGNYLSGPGLALIGVLLTKLTSQFGSFAIKSLSQIVETTSARTSQEAAINTLLEKQPQLYGQIAALNGDNLKIQQLVTSELSKQLVLQNEQAAARGKIFSNLNGAGFSNPLGLGKQKPFVINQRDELAINPKYPSFANPLNSAVSREISAGLSPSQVKVGRSNLLQSSNNPLGIGIYNTRDEPQGLNQGILRARSEGRNPKTYGLPNFADDLPYPYNLLPKNLVPSQYSQKPNYFNQNSLAPDSVRYGRPPQPAPFPKLLLERNPIQLSEISASTAEEYKKLAETIQNNVLKAVPKLLTQGIYKNPIHLGQSNFPLSENDLKFGFSDSLKQSYQNLGSNVQSNLSFENVFGNLKPRQGPPLPPISQISSFNNLSRNYINNPITTLGNFDDLSRARKFLNASKGRGYGSQTVFPEGYAQSVFNENYNNLGIGSLFNGKYKEAQNFAKNNNLDFQGRDLKQRLQSKALTASFILPVAGGILEQGIGSSYGNSATGRGFARAAGGLTNIASFGATGFGIGGPVGGGVGLGLGVLTELPSIIKAFSDTLPDLKRNLEELRDESQKTSTGINQYTEASQKLLDVQNGSLKVTNQQYSELVRQQSIGLSALPEKTRNKLLSAGGDIGKIASVGSIDNSILGNVSRTKEDELYLREKLFPSISLKATSSELRGLGYSAQGGVETQGLVRKSIEDRISKDTLKFNQGVNSVFEGNILNAPTESGPSLFKFLENKPDIRKALSKSLSGNDDLSDELFGGVLKATKQVNPEQISSYQSLIKQVRGQTGDNDLIKNLFSEDFFKKRSEGDKNFEINGQKVTKVLSDINAKLIQLAADGQQAVTKFEIGTLKRFNNFSTQIDINSINRRGRSDIKSINSGNNEYLKNYLGFFEQNQNNKDVSAKSLIGAQSSLGNNGFKAIENSLNTILIDTLKNLQNNKLIGNKDEISKSFTKNTSGIQNIFSDVFDFKKFNGSLSGITGKVDSLPPEQIREILSKLQRESNEIEKVSQLSNSKAGDGGIKDSKSPYANLNKEVQKDLVEKIRGLADDLNKQLSSYSIQVEEIQGNLESNNKKSAAEFQVNKQKLQAQFDFGQSELNFKTGLDTGLTRFQGISGRQRGIASPFQQLQIDAQLRNKGVENGILGNLKTNSNIELNGIGEVGGKINQFKNLQINASKSGDVETVNKLEGNIIELQKAQSQYNSEAEKTTEILNQQKEDLSLILKFTENVVSKTRERNQNLAAQGNFKELNSGENLKKTLFEPLQFGREDFYKQLNNDLQDFSINFKDSFKQGFREAITGAKDLGDALRDIGLNIANNILGKASDLAIDSIFGAAFNGIKTGFSGTSLLGKANGGYIPKFARGGFVNMGSGTKDDVPAFLTGGEFVLNKKAVNRIGKHNLESINNNIHPDGVQSDTVVTGKNSAKFLLANTANTVGRKDSFFGELNYSRLLSSYALTDPNNPQNKLRAVREGYGLERSLFERNKQDQLDSFEKQQLTSLYTAIGTAGVLAGVGALGAAKTPTDAQLKAYNAGNGPVSNSSAISKGYGSNPFADRLNTFYGRANGGYIPKFANGGYFGGDAPTDKFSVMVMGGEFIVNPKTVQSRGVDYFNNLNKLGSYAGGGYVSDGGNSNINLSDTLSKLIDINQQIRDSLNAKSDKKTENSKDKSGNNSPNFYITTTVSLTSEGKLQSTKTNTTSDSKDKDDKGNKEIITQLSKTIEGKVREGIIQESKNGGFLWEKFQTRK